MTAIHGAVASKGASASVKSCLLRARVQPIAAIVVAKGGLLAFHPISTPQIANIAEYRL